MQLTESKKHIQKGVQLTDKNFKHKLAANFRLTVYLNADQLVYAVADVLSRKLLHLQSYQFFNILNSTEYNEALNAMIMNDEVLHLGFGKKQVFVFSDCFTLVPTEFFKEENAEEFLKFNQTNIEGKINKSEGLKNVPAHFLSGFDEETIAVLTKNFKNAEIKNASAQWINQLIADNKKGEHFFCYVQPTTLQLLYIKDGAMKFFNAYSYKTPEDFIYYLMNAVNHLGLDKEKIQLLFCGELIQESAIYKFAYKFVRNIQFAARPAWVQCSDEMKFDSHFYFNLFCYEP